MKCKSCQGEVPPKFAHAISTNTCPLCGNEIMDPELQGALSTLKEAMAAIEKYPSEVFDWLKSNFDLVKESELRKKITGELALQRKQEHNHSHNEAGIAAPSSDEEVAFDSNGNQIAGRPIQDPAITSKFMKNAGIKQRNDTLKDLVKQIKKNVPHTQSAPVTQTTLDNMSNEEIARMRPEELEQLESLVSGDIPGASSAFSGSEESYDDEIPSFVLNMANNAKKTPGYNQADVLKLQKLQDRSYRTNSEMSRSGSVGLIRR